MVSGGAGLPLVGAMRSHCVPATLARHVRMSTHPLRHLVENMGEWLTTALHDAPSKRAR